MYGLLNLAKDEKLTLGSKESVARGLFLMMLFGKTFSVCDFRYCANSYIVSK